MGKFWAIGVGPGDPGLLTLKAVEVLGRVQVIYHAGPKPDQVWSGRHFTRPEPNLQLTTNGAGILAQRGDGGGVPLAAAAGFEASHGRCLGSHARGDFGLGQPRPPPRPQQLVQKRELLTLGVVFGPNG